MHVALVFPECHRQGGVERAVWETARHLAKHHRVSVVARTAEPPDGASWVPVPERGLRVADRPRRSARTALAPPFSLAAAGTLARIGPDAVISYGAECPPGDVLVVNSIHRAWLARAGPIGLGPVQVPGWTRVGLARHWQRLLWERTYYRAARSRTVIAVSAAVAEDLRRYYAAPTASVVPNGFSADEFSPQRRDARRAEARRDLGLDDAAIVLLFVANELRRKGLAVVLQALERLDDPRLHLLVAGRADPAPFLERVPPAVRRRVAYVGLSRDVAGLHAAGDVFVLPTEYEAFSLAVVEAMASGLPVITTGRPGAGDLVQNGRNGLLMQDPRSVGQLVSLIGTVLDPATRQRLGRAAAASVSDLEWGPLTARIERYLPATAR